MNNCEKYIIFDTGANISTEYRRVVVRVLDQSPPATVDVVTADLFVSIHCVGFANVGTSLFYRPSIGENTTAAACTEMTVFAVASIAVAGSAVEFRAFCKQRKTHTHTCGLRGANDRLKIVSTCSSGA